MRELIQKLENALLQRNPGLTESLRTGLQPEKVKKALQRASINGVIEPIVALYSWRDGEELHGYSDTFKIAFEAGFVPSTVIQVSEEIKKTFLAVHGIERQTGVENYHFTYLKLAILHMRSYKSMAQNLPQLSVLADRYFPFLWNGSDNWIAVDIELTGGNKVVIIQIGDEHPLREAYPSFEEFLKDAIRANETNEPLACLRTPGRPITD